MEAIVTGATKTPKPVRTTVFPWSALGVQARPTRGLKTCDLFWKTAVCPAPGKVRPPSTLKALAASWVIGALVYAAVAAAESGLRSEEHTSELQSPCNLVCR